MNIKCMMTVWLCLMSLMVVACAGEVSPSPTTDGGALVAASIAPLADFARQVGGDHVRVITLVPPGASPHTYELTPSQAEQVAKARLLVLNGVGLEYWADKVIQSADNPDLIVVDTSQGIEILEGDADEPGGNPHIWLDPQNAIVQVGHIRDALIRADPSHADDYRANAERYIAELEALDQEIANEVATWSNRQFIAFHPAWIYFARRYGLEQAAVIEHSPGREPSPAEVAQIVETAKRIGAKAIFAEPQFSPKAAQAIAEESGSQVLFLDPLGFSLEDPTYLNLMRYDVAQMAKALQRGRNAMEYVIELEHVTVRYQALVALEDVSLRVAPGEFLALIGPNGSGKTTLIKAILGLVMPAAGTVRLFGKPPQELDGDWKRVGYVPQTAQIDLRFPIRVFDVVLMGRYGQVGLIRRPGHRDRETTWRALEQVGMAELAQRPIGRLSGGQRQRTLVARALANEPELLLLDEPTTGVDVGTTEGLFDLLEALHQQGMTILVASHDVGVVAQHVNQVACVNRRLVAHGRPEEVLGGEVLKCMYGPQAAFVGHGDFPHVVVQRHGPREG